MYLNHNFKLPPESQVLHVCLVVKLAIIVLMYNCSVRLYLPLFVGGWMPYLRFCVCLRIMLSSTYIVLCLCFLFVFRFVYPMLPVSLDYPF